MFEVPDMEENYRRLRERLNLEAQLRAAVERNELQARPPRNSRMWIVSGIAVVGLLAAAGIWLVVLRSAPM